MPKDYSFQNLAGAKLQNADLRYADFTEADLQHAAFTGAKLAGADLRYANLEYAKLVNANLEYANLQNANLRHADMRRADLRYATFTGANLDGALIDYEIEEGLLLRVAHAALQDGALDMSDWHKCKTTHCIAGWAEVLSEKTRALAKTHGTGVAGLLTLGHEAHKYFYASNDDARTFLQGVIDNANNN
jgi:hypothetical protein